MFIQSSVANPLILYNARDLFTDHISYSVTKKYYTIQTYYIYIARLGIPGLGFEERRQNSISVGKIVIKSMISLMLYCNLMGNKWYLFRFQCARVEAKLRYPLVGLLEDLGLDSWAEAPVICDCRLMTIFSVQLNIFPNLFVT